ncbi:MAG: hypothetical protein Q8R83_08850 [Legionellaceae bacterium]|nr:hypothetical protein [Legionellaceae bacterium]
MLQDLGEITSFIAECVSSSLGFVTVLLIASPGIALDKALDKMGGRMEAIHTVYTPGF